ncbi:hypothetical protein V5N11_028012 [Cardamine amara subsp. amara]|uniref:Uncharacterized protein n=1 Tax=Cardamine amara subsp. amara TaxID=228776 RepID=A0ABD1AKI2_CARAN
MSFQDYCRKLKNLSDLLANVDSTVSNRNLMMHCLNGLTEKFDGIHNVIRHRVPFPSFTTARSMLLDEESRLNKLTRPTTSHTQTASSPSVLLVSESSGSDSQSRHSGGGNSGYNSGGNYVNFSKHGGRGGGSSNRGRVRNNHFGGNNHFGYHTTGNFAQRPPWSYGLTMMTAPFYPTLYTTIP